MLKKYFHLILLPLLVIGLSSCQTQMNNAMEAKYKDVAVKVEHLFDNGNVNELDNYITENAVDHQIDTSMSKKPGLAGVKEMFSKMQKIFPDLHTTIHSVAASGDTVFVYATSTGTTSEPFMGMPANTKASWSGVDVMRFEGDKIAEHWGFMDVNEIMKMMQSQQEMGSNKSMMGKKKM